jgi:NAD(P)-dependent dehydrogenase (short-subunit alcohol dehydrogenase family)
LSIKNCQFIVTGLSSELAQKTFEGFFELNEIYGIYNRNKISINHKNVQLSKINIESEEEIKDYISSIRDNLKNIVLVNFAAYKIDGLSSKYSSKDWDTTFNINVRSNFLFAKYLSPIMITNKWGRIINISSVRSQNGAVGASAYLSSKSALIGFNRSIAKEYARFGITSNILNLGYFDSGLFKKFTPERKLKYLSQVPSKKLGSSDDIFSAIHFLVSSDYTNGSVITIDGCMN